jgi:hypothetical protein
MSLRPSRPAANADTAAAIRSILDLAKLSLNTDAAKRGADDRAIPATDFYPDLAEKLSQWIVNGNVRLRNTSAGWRMTYHVSFIDGTTDLLTGSSRSEPKGADWSKLKQAMQQPPFWFRYNPADNSWNSNIARIPEWVFRAIADRTKLVESYLFNTAIPSGKISFFRGEDGVWKVSSFQTYIFQLEEVLYLLEKGYDFAHVDEKDDRDNDVWVRNGSYPLPDALLEAIDKRAAAVERAREQARLRAEEEERLWRARAEVEEAARVGRELMKQREKERLVQLQRNQERKRRIFNQYIKEGEEAVSEEDLQWYRETFAEAIEEAVSKAAIKQHEDRLKSTLARLPATSNARGKRLKYWQMSKIVEVVLETVARMSDEVVKAFQSQGMDPVADARRYTAKVRTKLRLPIPSREVVLFVRTVPSAAKDAVESGMFDQRAAIEWSMTFALDSEDRGAVNRALVDAGYREVVGGGQVQVRNYNTLVIALNGIWEDTLEEDVKKEAYLWNTQPATPSTADLSDAPPRATPPTPTPTPVDDEGFRPKKRNLFKK